MQVFHMVFSSFGHKHAILGGYNWRGVHGPGAAFQVSIEIFFGEGENSTGIVSGVFQL